jgi:hypothetical protein
MVAMPMKYRHEENSQTWILHLKLGVGFEMRSRKLSGNGDSKRRRKDMIKMGRRSNEKSIQKTAVTDE